MDLPAPVDGALQRSVVHPSAAERMRGRGPAPQEVHRVPAGAADQIERSIHDAVAPGAGRARAGMERIGVVAELDDASRAWPGRASPRPCQATVNRRQLQKL